MSRRAECSSRTSARRGQGTLLVQAVVDLQAAVVRLGLISGLKGCSEVVLRTRDDARDGEANRELNCSQHTSTAVTEHRSTLWRRRHTRINNTEKPLTSCVERVQEVQRTLQVAECGVNGLRLTKLVHADLPCAGQEWQMQRSDALKQSNTRACMR